MLEGMCRAFGGLGWLGSQSFLGSGPQGFGFGSLGFLGLGLRVLGLCLIFFLRLGEMHLRIPVFVLVRSILHHAGRNLRGATLKHNLEPT